MFRWFWRRTAPVSQEWQELDWVFSANTVCACCGKSGEYLLSVAFHAPDPMDPNQQKLQNSDFLVSTGDILTEDFARLGEHRFVRCVIPFALQGRNEEFLWGVWGSLSQTNFEEYLSRFDQSATHQQDPAFSYLCNTIPPTPAEFAPAECQMQFQPNAQRPMLRITDPDHPLFDIQENGVSPGTLKNWLHAMGHYGPASTPPHAPPTPP